MSIKQLAILIFCLFKSFTNFAQSNEDKFINNSILSSFIQIPDSFATNSVQEFLLVNLTLSQNNEVKNVKVFSDSCSYFRNFLTKIDLEKWNSLLNKERKIPSTVILPIFLIIVDSTTNLNRVTHPSYNDLQNQFSSPAITAKYYINDLVVYSAPSIKFCEKVKKIHFKPGYKPL